MTDNFAIIPEGRCNNGLVADQLREDENLQHVCQLQRESKGYFLVPVGVSSIGSFDRARP
eukprot:6361258-Amphidinium_carterae.1